MATMVEPTSTEKTDTTALTNEYWAAPSATPGEKDVVHGQWPPAGLINAYVQIAASHARRRRMEDGRWFADVVGLQGAWAEGATADEAFRELPGVIREWALLKIEKGDDDIPSMEGIDLNRLS